MDLWCKKRRKNSVSMVSFDRKMEDRWNEVRFHLMNVFDFSTWIPDDELVLVNTEIVHGVDNVKDCRQARRRWQSGAMKKDIKSRLYPFGNRFFPLVLSYRHRRTHTQTHTHIYTVRFDQPQKSLETRAMMDQSTMACHIDWVVSFASAVSYSSSWTSARSW